MKLFEERYGEVILIWEMKYALMSKICTCSMGKTDSITLGFCKLKGMLSDFVGRFAKFKYYYDDEEG